MSLSPGSSIGPYEIIDLLGAGAMGVVYRATDSRLGREVAIKVLPEEFAKDAERLARFNQEARTAGTLNHPNILAIYDVGVHEKTPYLVSELLRGETLTSRMKSGPVPLRKVFDYAMQIARGLSAAHARGIVHRDLKPDNLFLTTDGSVKILDFGLAKLVRSEGTGVDLVASHAGTMTQSGAILGTVGYMAPEQARGLPASPASDIFALGCTIYELATGTRAFRRASAMDTLAAILSEDPPPFPSSVRKESPGLVTLVMRCLEKEPSERFESARDLAFSLGLLTGEAPARVEDEKASSRGSRTADSDVVFRRLTFRRGSILRARFTPDGHSVIYGGAWEGHPVELFWMHLGNPDARSMGHPGTDIFGIAPNGELAVSLKQRNRTGFSYTGTLARMPMGGGTARQLMKDVDEADWSPDGAALAVVRDVDALTRLEFPAGKVLFETPGWISHPRVSRDGTSVGFIHHEYRGNDAGTVMVVDRDGKARILSEGWGTIRGLAWSADKSEIWFTAHPEGAGRNLHAVNMDGQVRVLRRVPGQLCIQDIFPDGRALFTHSMERQAIMVRSPEEEHERDLSWLDWSLLRDVSSDWQWILLQESGEGGGSEGSICMRPTDGSSAVVLGGGNPQQFSPDGASFLAIQTRVGRPGQLNIVPTGVGEPQPVDLGSLRCLSARWTHDQTGIIVAGTDADRPARLYHVDLATSGVRPIGPEGPIAANFEISPDGNWLSVKVKDQPSALYPVAGGEPRAIPGLKPGEEMQPWTAESNAVLVLARLLVWFFTCLSTLIWPDTLTEGMIRNPQIINNEIVFMGFCF